MKDIIAFIHDNNSASFSMVHNGTTYDYILNQQGDVIQLVDASGGVAAEYRYDSWGKILSATGTMASVNPLRYRGYYYDTESGFYYLNSRYYDPAICRFINADQPEYAEMSAGSISGTNLFAYCENNPVSSDDQDGEFVHIIAGAIVGAAISIATQAIDDASSQYDKKTKAINMLIAGISGAITGAVASTGVGLAGSVIANATVGAATDIALQLNTTRTVKWKGVAVAATTAAASAIISDKLSKTTVNYCKLKSSSTSLVKRLSHARKTGSWKYALSTVREYIKYVNVRRYYLGLLKNSPKELFNSVASSKVSSFISSQIR